MNKAITVYFKLVTENVLLPEEHVCERHLAGIHQRTLCLYKKNEDLNVAVSKRKVLIEGQ